MRIIVCMKQGLDPQTVKISRSREELDLREARRVTQPEDKYALEAALRLREAEGGEVIAVVVGGQSAEDAAREAVAMGADKAVLIVQEGEPTGRGITLLVQATLERTGLPDLILTGQAGGLDPSGPIAGRLAAALDLPLLTGVMALNAGSGNLTALADCDGVGVRMPVPLPSVVEVMPGADRPRYPHPSRIAVAWNEGFVEKLAADDLGVGAEAREADIEMGSLVLGAERQRGQMISGTPAAAAAELAGILTGRRLI